MNVETHAAKTACRDTLLNFLMCWGAEQGTEVLRCWGVEVLRCWGVRMPRCWGVEEWSLEVLRCWGVPRKHLKSEVLQGNLEFMDVSLHRRHLYTPLVHTVALKNIVVLLCLRCLRCPPYAKETPRICNFDTDTSKSAHLCAPQNLSKTCGCQRWGVWE